MRTKHETDALAETYKETQAENANQGELLAFPQVQASQGRERQNEDNDVGDDVPRRVVIPEWKVGNTRPWGLWEPEFVDGCASEDDDEEL
jgi:hypothetical protein